MNKIKENYQGLILVFIISYISFKLGEKFPNIGGAGFGILSGMIFSSFFNCVRFTAGINFASRELLHLSIVLLGASLNILAVFYTGIVSFPVILTGISISFLTANIIGKFLNINFKMRNLIGAGTGICGGSAIAALSSVIKPEEKEISYSLSTIFLFNIVAVFTFPILGHLFNMSQNFFGMFAGSAINDTSSVVAAAYIYGDEAGVYATTVKLARTLMIIPIVIFFSKFTLSKNITQNKKSTLAVFPWFITAFIGVAAVNTILHTLFKMYSLNSLIFFDIFIKFAAESGKFLIITAITAIGLKTNLKSAAKSGIKPLLLGFITWLMVIISTLSIQIIFGIN